MKELPKPKLSYYQLNKDKWRKGCKYYTYKPVSETNAKIPVKIKHGKFIISFD